MNKTARTSRWRAGSAAAPLRAWIGSRPLAAGKSPDSGPAGPAPSAAIFIAKLQYTTPPTATRTRSTAFDLGWGRRTRTNRRTPSSRKTRACRRSSEDRRQRRGTALSPKLAPPAPPPPRRRTACKYGGKNIAFHVNEGSTPFWLSLLIEFEDGEGDIGSMQLKQANSAQWLDMKHVWGATWCLYGGPTAGPFSVRLTTLSAPKTLTARDVIPKNWAPRGTYTSRLNFEAAL